MIRIDLTIYDRGAPIFEDSILIDRVPVKGDLISHEGIRYQVERVTFSTKLGDPIDVVAYDLDYYR